MRLLTFNTLFRGDVRLRLRALAAVLESSPYDIVCLQELMYRHQLRMLQRLAPSFAYDATSGGAVLGGGLAILSRRPITASRFARFPLARPLRPELLMRKGAQVVRLEFERGELVIVNTHMSANRDGDWSDGNRYTRLARTEFRWLAATVNAIDPLLPVLVTGDFNVPRDSPALADFLADTGTRDAMAGDREPTYRPTSRWPNPPAFDHVLLRGGGLIADARIVLRDAVTLDDGREAYLSDHFGVEAAISTAANRPT